MAAVASLSDMAALLWPSARFSENARFVRTILSGTIFVLMERTNQALAVALRVLTALNDRRADLALYIRAVHRTHRRPHQSQPVGRNARRPEVLQRHHFQAPGPE